MLFKNWLRLCFTVKWKCFKLMVGKSLIMIPLRIRLQPPLLPLPPLVLLPILSLDVVVEVISAIIIPTAIVLVGEVAASTTTMVVVGRNLNTQPLVVKVRLLQVYLLALVNILALLLLILSLFQAIYLLWFALMCALFASCLATLFFPRSHCYLLSWLFPYCCSSQLLMPLW